MWHAGIVPQVSSSPSDSRWFLRLPGSPAQHRPMCHTQNAPLPHATNKRFKQLCVSAEVSDKEGERK